MASVPVPKAAARTGRPSMLRGIDTYRVAFTGSGAEYFRVWVVNIVLSVVTLSLYTPWARRRTAQYFYGHTQIADSPLEFVAELRRMVFGFLVYFGFYAAYELAVYTEQDLATTLLAAAFAVLAPFVWASAMRFRYRATRWRGIRLAFVATWKEVYTASWPVFVVAAVWVGVFFTAEALTPDESWIKTWVIGQDGVPALMWALLGAAALATLLCVIRLDFNYTRLRLSRVRMGGQMGRWKLGYASFLRVWLGALGIFLLGLPVLVAMWVGLSAVMYQASRRLASPNGVVVVGLLMGVLTVLTLVLASLPARAWREARVFQLVWNSAGFGQMVRTRTRLRTSAYLRLRVKNVLLSFLTLGFYRPFAMASEYAAKVGSVSLYVKGQLDQLQGELVQEQGAFGDAAADAFGLDLIG